MTLTVRIPRYGIRLTSFGNNLSALQDHQEIKIQEQSCNLVPGHKPGSLWVSLEDDLVEIVKPGDHVEIIGVVKQRWNPLGNQQEEKTVVELVLKAHNLWVQNSETSNIVDAEEAEREFSDYWSRPENRDVVGRNKLVASFCPELFGLYIAKLGEMIDLFQKLPISNQSNL